jgi:biopolymer transport protein TolR
MGMNTSSGGGNRGGRRRSNRQSAFSEINITPMVDVMLVLLVIFMVAAPMMTTGVTVDLPKTAASPISGQDEPLSISVTSDGKVFLQKTPLALGQIQAKLNAIAGQKKDTRIFVRGDKNVDYGRIMQVVSEINAAGFTKVALLTETGATGTAEQRK